MLSNLVEMSGLELGEPLNENLRVNATDPHLLNGAKGGVIDVKGGATLAKHRFALAYGKHKVGRGNY